MTKTKKDEEREQRGPLSQGIIDRFAGEDPRQPDDPILADMLGWGSSPEGRALAAAAAAAEAAAAAAESSGGSGATTTTSSSSTSTSASGGGTSTNQSITQGTSAVEQEVSSSNSRPTSPSSIIIGNLPAPPEKIAVKIRQKKCVFVHWSRCLLL